MSGPAERKVWKPQGKLVLAGTLLGGLSLGVLFIYVPALRQVFHSWWLAAILMGLYPSIIIGTMVYFDAKALRLGMALKSHRKWAVALNEQTIIVTREGRPARSFQLDQVGEAALVYDDNFTPPLNLADALLIDCAGVRVKIPASAQGFEQLLSLLESSGKLRRVKVEAFGWD